MKKLDEHIEANNTRGLTQVTLAPLPASAQLLNVIGAVLNGLARTMLHNSNCMSVVAAKAAINRYFEKRNPRLLHNPKRAGKKI